MTQQLVKNTLRKSALVGAICMLSAPALAQQFEQESLPYDSAALEPMIDKQTMDIHFGRHHAGYVENLNKEVSNNSELEGKSLEELMENMSDYSTAVRNNGGGHYNHQLFWQVMAPVGQGGEPSDELNSAIEEEFGSLTELKAEFKDAATSQFGSGWAWLIVNDDDELEVTSTPNQDNPLMDVVDENGEPVLALDVWEHAYYLSYQNSRANYIDAWWQLVNWKKVNELYDEATSD